MDTIFVFLFVICIALFFMLIDMRDEKRERKQQKIIK